MFNLSWQNKKSKCWEAKGKKRYHRACARGAATAKLDYKSAVVGLENDTFDVGAWSDPAKFSKSQRNIKNYKKKPTRNPTT